MQKGIAQIGLVALAGAALVVAGLFFAAVNKPEESTSLESGEGVLRSGPDIRLVKKNLIVEGDLSVLGQIQGRGDLNVSDILFVDPTTGDVVIQGSRQTLKVKTNLFVRDNAGIGVNPDDVGIVSPQQGKLIVTDSILFGVPGTGVWNVSGNVGIGTTTPSFKLDVQGGQINVSGGLCIAGDCRTSWPVVGGGGTPGFFGDGSDGDVVISTSTTLTRDMYYNNLTVNSGTTLFTGGYRIFVRNVATINGTIDRSGNNGATGSNGDNGGAWGASGSGGIGGGGGAALTAGTLYGGLPGPDGKAGGNGGWGQRYGFPAQPGGNGVNGAAGLNELHSIGSNGIAGIGSPAGGKGGDGRYGFGQPINLVTGMPGGASSIGGIAGTVTTSKIKPKTVSFATYMYEFDGATVTPLRGSAQNGGSGSAGGGGSGGAVDPEIGGTGGGGGGSGGSGSNGGIIVLLAKTIAGSGSISARGGSGGSGGAGGNGGNGGSASQGGYIYYSGGGGGGSGGTGGNGGNGGVIVLSYSQKIFNGVISMSGDKGGAGGLKGVGGLGGGDGATNGQEGSDGSSGQDGIDGQLTELTL